MPDNSKLEDFLAFSSLVTGFSAFRLQGTGQAEAYCATVARVVGDETLGELLAAFRRARAEAGDDDEGAGDALLRAYVLSDEKLGPIARNIIKLWYVSTWYQLPAAWRDVFGASEHDTTFVVSPAAYPEGLLWPAVGANPPGAKAPGYGTWANPPSIPDIDRAK